MENYLIWSHEHAAWWRAAYNGYTKDVTEAGRYPRAHALQICRQAIPGSRGGVPNELPVREVDLLMAGVIQIPVEDKADG